MKHLCIAILYVIFALTMSGCATVKNETQTTTTSDTTVKTATPGAKKDEQKPQTASAKQVQNWQINGKIAVQTSKDSGSATVTWAQHNGRYNISLMGPLGSHNMQLTGGPGWVSLRAENGQRYQAQSPEQLLAERWGFRLPVSNLNYWIRGLPVPGVAADTQYDGSEHLIRLVQHGWQVVYSGYANINGIDLPKSISISSPSLKTKIIIYQWKI